MSTYKKQTNVLHRVKTFLLNPDTLLGCYTAQLAQYQMNKKKNTGLKNAYCNNLICAGYQKQ